MEFLKQNYEWLFSGIGVTVISWLLLRHRKKEGPQMDTNINTIRITNHVGIPKTANKEANSKIKNIRKEDCRLLFIDDRHSEFKMVSILKKAGWINTKAIKDLTDLDDHKVVEASIIFVDINGVGTHMFEDQGLGLAAALKDKYPMKTIILYSADSTGDRFDKKLKKVDDSLPKNAEPYEFISLIEQYSQGLTK